MPVRRRRWVQALALLIGLAVFVAHVATLRIPETIPDWMQFERNDLAAHFAMLFTFALVYRLSYAGAPRGAHRATLFICCGWGAVCECAQFFLPSRSFNFIELGINTVTPAVVVGLSALLSRR